MNASQKQEEEEESETASRGWDKEEPGGGAEAPQHTGGQASFSLSALCMAIGAIQWPDRGNSVEGC